MGLSFIREGPGSRHERRRYHASVFGSIRQMRGPRQPIAPLVQYHPPMNLYHRRFCSSAGWADTLESTVIPWVLREYDLGDNVLEIGPGPGLATNVLRQKFAAVTCIEIDEKLALDLAGRMQGTNVTVKHADATAMPFADETFTGAISMTMLHHVPSRSQQDRVLAETFRVLKPGGTFVGSDSMMTLKFRITHFRDTMVVVDPTTFAQRLQRVGFVDVTVREGKGAFRFRAVKPA
jgi:SAM-dependent methyltransferase